MSDERAEANIERDKSYMYDYLVNDENSLFNGHNKTDIFLAAASLGFYFKESSTIKDKQNLFITTTLGGNKEKIWLMKSIAISQCGITVLKSMKEVVKICQEFANSGIDRLYSLSKNNEEGTREIVKIMEDALDSLVE